jgi:hypothetical protein
MVLMVCGMELSYSVVFTINSYVNFFLMAKKQAPTQGFDFHDDTKTPNMNFAAAELTP